MLRMIVVVTYIWIPYRTKQNRIKRSQFVWECIRRISSRSFVPRSYTFIIH